MCMQNCDVMATKAHFYTNPAFCQQSEYPARVLSPKNVRQSPVGAQCIPQYVDQLSPRSDKTKNVIEENLEEQEFYEEVVVDDKGFITDKKFVVVAQNNEGKKYIQVPQNEDRHGSRYGLPQAEERKGARYGITTPTIPKLTRSQSQRYEYIQMQEQKMSPSKKCQSIEDIEVVPGRIHRYAVIDTEQETELSSTQNTRYALVPVDHLNSLTANRQQILVPNKNRYEYIQPHPANVEPAFSPNRYEYLQTTPQKPQTNWNYIHQLPRPNPAATQKLHEILSTPKKSLNLPISPQSSRRLDPAHLSPIAREFQSKTPQKVKKTPPKAQQKLNYALSTRQVMQDKRHTAIVAPICSSPIQSVYSETTFSGSWSNLSTKKTPIQAGLNFAAIIMFLCGAVTSGLSFYMIYLMERQYYLDFGVIAGFTCLVLGLLGFRSSRHVYWLPNRNYISGYIILSVFSLSTCIALLILLVKHPRKGTPLADMTSGAVCGFSVLSIVLATMGVVSSYCCKYPPPDNRVQHCAEGFSV